MHGYIPTNSRLKREHIFSLFLNALKGKFVYVLPSNTERKLDYIAQKPSKHWRGGKKERKKEEERVKYDLQEGFQAIKEEKFDND